MTETTSTDEELQPIIGAAQAGCYRSLSKVTRVWFPLRTRTIVQGLVASFFGRSGGAMSLIIMGRLLLAVYQLHAIIGSR